MLLDDSLLDMVKGSISGINSLSLKPLATFSFQEKDEHTINEEDNKDPIDFGSLDGREVVITKCGHIFAKETIMKPFIMNGSRCPIDDTLLFPNEISAVKKLRVIKTRLATYLALELRRT